MYRYKCDRLDCDEEYIGDLQTPLGKGSRNISRVPATIYEHTNTAGHQDRVDNFSVVGRVVHKITRTIKEAIYIRGNDPSFSRNIGKFQCPIYGKRSCSIPLTSISGGPFHNPSCQLHMANPCLAGHRRLTACANISQHQLGMQS